MRRTSTTSLQFITVLYASGRRHTPPSGDRAPAYFVDLNLDKIVDRIVQGREEYGISAFFYSPLECLEDILYRQEIIQDVTIHALYKALMAYSAEMKNIREISEEKTNRFYFYQQRRWELECILLYCQAVTALYERIAPLSLSSDGMINFRHYLRQYIESENFTGLYSTATMIRKSLEAVQYGLKIKGDTIIVERYHQEKNYSDEILDVFSKFKQHDVNVEVENRHHSFGMNHIEAQVLDCVARLFPAEFHQLDVFIDANRRYRDNTLDLFEREVQFYLAVVEYIEKFRQKGLPFCIPEVLRDKKAISAVAAFDLALAEVILEKKEKVVCNDFSFQEHERIFVISGPNQGGKPTFARMIGQLHFFALLGIYVPARQAKLFLTDTIFTHFEKSENIYNLRGKLYDDLVRIKAILDAATSHSLIIMNEIFTSTTSRDAIYLGTRVIKKIVMLDALCVCVTFIDELTALDPSIVSLMSTVEHNNAALRTYKITRKPADGIAWSTTLVIKHGLTYEQIKTRLNG